MAKRQTTVADHGAILSPEERSSEEVVKEGRQCARKVAKLHKELREAKELLKDVRERFNAENAKLQEIMLGSEQMRLLFPERYKDDGEDDDDAE